MLIALVIISSVACIIAAIAVFMILDLRKRIDGINELSELSQSSHRILIGLAGKLDYIGNNVGNELSRNRSETAENNARVNKRLEDINESAYKRNAELGDRITDTLRQSLSKMSETNEKKLDDIRAVVDEKLTATLTTRLDSSFKTVSEQLENLYKSLGEMKLLSTGVTENVTALNRVLTNVKTRGTWAEYQLEGILAETIPGMYVKNYSPGGGSGVVEFAVKIPSGDSGNITYLPIDSKFPIEDYQRLISASEQGDTDGIMNARKSLERRIVEEAKSIRKYIVVPETTPFAIMYLATEGLYAEIAASSDMPIERLRSEFNVMIAGPTTITAMLSSLAMGFRAITVNEKAEEIRLLLGAIKDQYNKFDEVLKRIKRKIGEADSAVDDAAKRNDIIVRKLKNVDANTSLETDTEIISITNGENHD